MRKNRVLGFAAVTIIFMAASGADAFTDVCTLANTEVPGSIRVSSQELSAYKDKLRKECDLSEKYQQMVRKAQKFGITLDRIYEFQAMRYVDRSAYYAARAENVPVPLIYQVVRSDYQKDLSQRSTVVWDNFSLGIRQLEAERARVATGARFEVQDLLRIHRGYYQLSKEIGDFGHDPYLGMFKSPISYDRYWWKLQPDDVPRIKALVADANATFAAYGLVPTASAGLERYQTEVLSVRVLDDGTYAIFGGDSRANEENITRLLSMTNAALSQARAGQHMTLNGRLVSPAELALLSQQFFVAVHPLSDGNGRTSRFVQELILTLFSLPPGSSGDLMGIDVTTRTDEYYLLATGKTGELLTSVDQCLESVYLQEMRAGGVKTERSSKGQSSNRVSEPLNAAALDQSKLDYNCRILK